MDKQKEIEKMEFILASTIHDCEQKDCIRNCEFARRKDCKYFRAAKDLHTKGYRDVRAAVKEFSDKILSKIYSALDYCPNNDYEEAYHNRFRDLRDYINDVVKEMCCDEVSKNDEE